jgi:hypothetical protein
VREHRYLEGEVGVLVVRVRRRSCERAVEAGSGTKECGRLLRRAVDDRGVELEGASSSVR